MSIKVIDCGTSVMAHGGHFGKIKENSDGDILFFPKGTDVLLKGIRKKVEDETYYLELQFQTMLKELKTVLIPRAELMDRSTASLLSSKGLCLDEKSLDLFQIYVNTQFEEFDGNVCYVHHSLGWDSTCKGEEMRPFYKAYSSVGEVSSDYLGNWAVKPKGTWEEWKRMVEVDVLPYAPICTALLIGLSAVLFGYIYEDALLGNPVFSLSGNSSSGKTTLAMLAASVAFAPVLGKTQFINAFGDTVKGHGGILSWSATPNALLGRLCGLNGVPVVMDEIGRAKIANFDDVVYALHDGVDKCRMTKDANIKESEPFHAPIFSVGEIRLSDRCGSAPDGVRTRIFEFGGTLTVDADHAQRIKTCCKNNYALAAPRFAAALLQEISKSEILELYEEKWRRFVTLVPKTKFAERRAQQFAGVLLTTAELAKRGLGLNFDIDKIEKYLVDCEADSISEDEDISARAYREVLNWVNSNPANFSEESAPYAKKYGKIYLEEDVPQRNKAPANLVREIAIRIPALEDFLRRKKYFNVHLILSTWREHGLLNCEKGKLYRKRTIDTVQEHLYVLREFEDEPSEDDLSVAEEENAAVRSARKIYEEVARDVAQLDEMDDIA